MKKLDKWGLHLEQTTRTMQLVGPAIERHVLDQAFLRDLLTTPAIPSEF
jgi:hypothetical protein